MKASQEQKHLRKIIGTHAILEALKYSADSQSLLWIKKGWESSGDLREIVDLSRKKRVSVTDHHESQLNQISASHQGAVLMVGKTPEFDLERIKAKKISTLVLLDGVEDPHNLGAVLRTSWLMSVDGILIPEDRAVGLSPAVHKVASGGAEHVPILRCGKFSNYLEELKEYGFWIFGLSHQGKSTIFDLKLPEKVIWCLGAEDKGLRSTTSSLCDELVRIPQADVAASYNVSVATAIALTETFRQRPK